VLLGRALVRCTSMYKCKPSDEKGDPWDGAMGELSEAAGISLERDGLCVVGFEANDAARKDVQAKLEEGVRWYLTTV